MALVLDGETYQVIGVMPPAFKFPSWAQPWTPLAWTDEKRAVRGNHNCLVIGRLKADVDIRTAQAELSAVSTRLEHLYPEDDKGWGVKILTLREQMVGKILARKKGNRHSLGAGATRFAILRQVLAETAVLEDSSAMLPKAL